MSGAVLVPLNGSELSKRAIPYGLALARAQHRGLVLARVLEPRGAPGRPLVQEPMARCELEHVAEGIRSDELHVETVVSSTLRGTVAQVILRIAQQRVCEAIVMSTHGRSGPDRWVFGSVAEDLLRQSSVPVLLVPSHRGRSWAADKQLRVMIPLDGSELAEQVVAPLLELLEPLAADALLVSVLPPASAEAAAYILEDRPAEVEASQRALESIAEMLRDTGLSVRTRVAFGAPTAAVINTLVGEEAIDVIAMATHGRTGLARVVLGSVASETLASAEVPLLLLRPRSLGGMFTPPEPHQNAKKSGPLTFLVAVDVSDKAECAIGATVALARASGGRVVLLNCFWPPIDTANVVADTRAECLEYARAERRLFLDELARAFQGIEVSTRVEEQTDGEEVDECVARVARELDADVVVVVTGAASTPAGVILGGFTQGIVRLSPCPVLVIQHREI